METQHTVEMSDILIVEDNENNLITLQMLLKSKKYPIRTARDAATTFQLIQDSIPELILLDIGLPDTNGIEICRKLKSLPEMQEVPVIFLTAYDDDKIRRDAFAAGGIDYITKPFQAEEVLARVNAHWAVQTHRRLAEMYYRRERDYLKTLLEIRSEIISGVSHDLKNPISSVKLSTALIRRRLNETSPDLLSYLDRIDSATDCMCNLITNVLDLALVETGRSLNKRPIHLADLIRHCIESLLQLAQDKQMVIKTDFPATTVYVEADSVMICRVIDNLLSNAIKYSDPGKEIHIRIVPNGSKATVQVRDNGYGIPAVEIPRVFQRFFRLPGEKYQAPDGTGLGLAIAKSIVELHDGQIWVESQEGLGSTFFFTLPLAQSAVAC